MRLFNGYIKHYAKEASVNTWGGRLGCLAVAARSLSSSSSSRHHHQHHKLPGPVNENLPGFDGGYHFTVLAKPVTAHLKFEKVDLF
jgi:hypothetical protein